jgi:hypothetical protein
MRFPPSVVELAYDWAPERTSAGPERSGGLGGTESCAGGLSCDNGTEERGKTKEGVLLGWKEVKPRPIRITPRSRVPAFDNLLITKDLTERFAQFYTEENFRSPGLYGTR